MHVLKDGWVLLPWCGTWVEHNCC